MTAKDGNPCKKCGTSRWDKRGECIACGNERKKQWKLANRDKENERKKQWKISNSDKQAQYTRRWDAANHEKMAEYARHYNRRYRAANPEKEKATKHRRRTRKNQAGGSFTAAEWKALVAHQNGRCLACGKEARLTADHIIPIAKGGSSDISNIQGLCKSCNSSKCDKVIDYRNDGGLIRWIQRKLFD